MRPTPPILPMGSCVLPSPRLRLVAASIVATAAVVAGHALVYELGPTAHAHTHALAEAGHAHWPLPWVAAALLAVLGGCAYGFAPRLRPGGSGWGAVWIRLASGQVTGFLLLEAGERVAAGIGAGQLLGEPVVVAGVVVQIAAACLSAVALRTGARLAAWLRRPARPVGVAVPDPLVPSRVAQPPRPARPDRLGAPRRGPPARC
jgi:hypothetical protein